MKAFYLTVCSIFLLQAADISSADPVGVCPAEDGEEVTFLTDSESCSVFYKCQTGTPFRFECPGGLDFSTALEVCVFPEDANCGGDPGNNNGGNNNGTPDISGEDPGDVVQPPDNGGGDQPVGECPEEDGEFVTLLPDASDCTIFYKCDRGNPVLTNCPPGLYFNPQLTVCDFPDSAGCGSGSNGTDGNNNSTPDISGEDPGDVVQPPDNGGGDQPVGECPQEDGEFVTLLPDASDCTIFYKCDRGNPVLTNCPSGLYFNPQLTVCDFPDSAGCGSGSNGTDGNNNSTPDISAEDPGDVVQPPDNGGGDQPVGECPEEDGEFVTLLPDASDCTIFYKCDRGNPVLTNCPPGLYFNPQLTVCDFPDSAGCGSGSNGTDGNNNSTPDIGGEDPRGGPTTR